MLPLFKAYFGRLAERLSSSRTVARDRVYKIFHNANALKVSWAGPVNDTGEIVIAWRDIVRVEVFKRDMYAVDLICVTFHLSAEKSLEINEDMDGWESLMQKLPEYLPGCQTFGDWFTEVAFPAFKRNLKVIYRRQTMI
jgi:hypothetical protein